MSMLEVFHPGANTKKPKYKYCSPHPQNPNPQTQKAVAFHTLAFLRCIMTGYQKEAMGENEYGGL